MELLIIGAGNVGAHIAYLSLFSPRIDRVLIYDIQKELVRGKVLDLSHAAGVLKRDIEFRALDELSQVSGDIVVITAGRPRRQGMTRLDLLEANINIMQDIIKNLNAALYTSSIFIIVSNPVDVLTYYFYQKTKIARNRLIGMSGALDTGRFRYYLHKKLSLKVSELEPLVIGTHSKDMLCIYEGLERSLIDEAGEETKNAGSRIVSYYKGGSAYFAPAAGVKVLLDSIIEDKNDIIPAVTVLEGEYGYQDIAFGLPLRISKKGVAEVIELNLSQTEKEQLDNSIKPLKDAVSYLKEKSLIE